MTDAEVYTGAAIIGAASGMRTLAGPALVSQISHSGILPLSGANLNFLKHPASAQGSFVAAIAELVFDKLPNTPSRVAPGPLIARALAGGFSGAVLTTSKKRSAFLGAMLGSIAALGAASCAYHLRRTINEKLHVPDTIIALAEDAVVFACAGVVLNRIHESNRNEASGT